MSRVSFLRFAGSLILWAIPAMMLNAQLVLNEIIVNPPGDDNPYEYVELRGTPGTTLNNIFLCVFEGDSASAGNCDLSIPLNGVTVGSNGLIFVGTSLGYPNIPSETYFKDTLLFGIPGGYLENGNTTFALIFSTVNIIEDADYDLNNDGQLDLPQGAVLLDAVGWTNGDQYALIYGGVVLTQSAGTPDAAVRFYDDMTPFSKPAWYNGDLTDLTTFDPLEISDNFPVGEQTGMTPGSHNIPNEGVGFCEIVHSAHFKMYPNPASTLVNIETESGQRVLISDLSGKAVYDFVSQTGKEQISLEQLPAGLFLVHIFGDSASPSVAKLVVTK
ncbi:MAG: T9SS type A sorting domain-containing protein [Bacteroidetes bacterium]|nr:T9SS type A sorting domain-containing protein [Bacteroidota bacterium]